MHSIISTFLFISAFGALCFSHDGIDHGNTPHEEPKAIENGKLTGKDEVTYFDAGAQILWAGRTLKRKITNTNQVIYRYNGEISDDLFSTKPDITSNYLELKVPKGGELLKAFSFDHAGDAHAPVEILSPDFSSQVEISRHQDFKITWTSAFKPVQKPKQTPEEKPAQSSEQPATLVKIIIEVLSPTGDLKGHLTVSTQDDGEYIIPVNLLDQLPEGQAKIAVKKIWLGQFKPFPKQEDTLGVKTVMSIVAKAKVTDN